MSIEQTTLAYSLIAPIDSNVTSVLEPLAEELAQSQNGYQVVQGLILYVFRVGEVGEFDESAVNHADAILFVAQSDYEAGRARDLVDWGAAGWWYVPITDPFGNQVKAFREATKVVRVSFTVSLYLDILAFRLLSPGDYAVRGSSTNLIVVEKEGAGGVPVYSVSTMHSADVFRFELSPSGLPVVARQRAYSVTRSEITTDLTDSRILTERYLTLRAALRNLAASAILVTDGYQALIALRDRDVVKGIVYSSHAGISVIGIYEGQVPLARIVGLKIERLASVKLASFAYAAAGSILASYELSLALTSPDEMTKRLHLERAAAVAIDTVVMLWPPGASLSLAWSVTTLAMSFIMPNEMAASITSSPGSTIVFLAEYFFSSGIPPQVAKGVLDEVIRTTILMVEENNRVLKVPSVPVFP